MLLGRTIDLSYAHVERGALGLGKADGLVLAMFCRCPWTPLGFQR